MMMQHTTTMSSSSAAVTNKAKRGVVGLQGPRPLPLSLPGTTPSASSPPRPAKRPRVVVSGDDGDVVRAPPGPVILYEHTPKVIHARPDEFKALVQRLTSHQPTTETETEGAGDQEAEPLRHAQRAAPPTSSQQDPLVLTLGQHPQVPPPLLPPSPGGAGGGFLLSPGSFLFSPATMQAIHELIS